MAIGAALAAEAHFKFDRGQMLCSRKVQVQGVDIGQTTGEEQGQATV